MNNENFVERLQQKLLVDNLKEEEIVNTYQDQDEEAILAFEATTILTTQLLML